EPEPPAHQRHRVERRDAGDLVDDQHPRLDHARIASATAASTSRVTASSAPVTVKPAALRWPPPPNLAAMRWTSTSPLPRRLTFTCPPRSRSRPATRTEAIERG